MAHRRLNADEAHAWAKVMASVRPLRGVVPTALPQPPLPSPSPAFGTPADSHREKASQPPKGEGDRLKAVAQRTANTLDGSWDRRLSRGLAQPDSSLDLHGHTLHSAHSLLDQGLERATARGDRVLLLVTGKPPRPESERPHARGAIRAAIADWLASSRFADRIAAVRNAHPRHGGAGALYIVLRRA